jgi:hypothetical protein
MEACYPHNLTRGKVQPFKTLTVVFQRKVKLMGQVMMKGAKGGEIYRVIGPAPADRMDVMDLDPAVAVAAISEVVDMRTAAAVAPKNRMFFGGP